MLAERTILEGLKDGGLLTGNIDEMLENGIGGIFMPHGQRAPCGSVSPLLQAVSCSVISYITTGFW